MCTAVLSSPPSFYTDCSLPWLSSDSAEIWKAKRDKLSIVRLSERVDKHDYRCVGNVILAFRQCTIQHQAIIYDWPALIPSLIPSATHYHCSKSLCLLQWNYKPIIFLVGWVCACGEKWAIQALVDSPLYLVQMAQKGKTMTDINAALQQKVGFNHSYQFCIECHWSISDLSMMKPFEQMQLIEHDLEIQAALCEITCLLHDGKTSFWWGNNAISERSEIMWEAIRCGEYGGQVCWDLESLNDG